jgi:Ni/Fe-hydrogenase 1 B-type cytochrome subunit
MNAPSEYTPTLVRVRVWDLPTRYTHWLIALSIFVLVPTGLYIGRPFGPGTFLMGWVKRVHFWAATVFTLAVLARIVWMFIGNRYARWNELLPVTKRRIVGVFKTIFFYTLIFRKPPTSLGHNPLAGASYLAVFGMYLAMIASGLALYAPSTISPLHAFTALLPILGGAASARYIHHVVMWLLVIFVLAHMATALLTSLVEGNGEFDSIFSGYKELTPDELREVRNGEAQDDANHAETVRRLFWWRRRHA